MKKVTTLAIIFLLAGLAGKAQCDKKTKWTASKMEMVDTAGNVQSREGAITVITGDGKIVVTAPDEELTGSITDYACNWADKNNGKMSFKSELTDKQGTLRHATVTIEAKDGSTTIVLEAKEELTKIRLPINDHQEVN